jgi:MGT family glycosyltransferase
MRVLQSLVAFGGNMPPQLAITRELVDRGHQVQVLTSSVARDRVAATGAELIEFRGWHDDIDLTRPECDPIQDWAARTQLGAAKRTLGALTEVLPLFVRSCVQALERSPADVVVFDFLLNGAAVAAERARIPSVALVHCPYPMPVDGAPPLFSGLAPKAGPLGAARDRILGALNRRFLARGLPALNHAREDLGLAPLKRWYDQVLAADRICVLTAPELDFSSRGRLPANVHYVGPSFEPYATEWESPWPETNTDPLVLISFSTTYMNQCAVVQRVLDAVAPLRVRALLTAGPALDLTQLRLPDNARAVDFIPHRTVLPHADLVITHAGWQTINAALADGVPLVCIPDGRDQPDNAVRVAHVGAGVRARKSTPPRELRAIIEAAIADPALKRGAQNMASALARSNGTTATADAIEQLVNRHRRATRAVQ